ncbi:MAG: hypothetical protein IK099_07610 [Clostridia bacterium]|nr:hypothetical protein [Clostridia bacterium]
MFEKMESAVNLEQCAIPELDSGLDESKALETMEQETNEAQDAEAPAGLEEVDAVSSMEGMMDALQLTDTEKESFRSIGKDVSGLPMENGVRGYKRGSCYDRLIPIYS